jgi:hypothetical protein
MATYSKDITRSIEPAMADPGTLAKAAQAKAGAFKTMADLAGDVYKNYTEYKIAGYEKEASELATEFFVSGEKARSEIPALEETVAARETMFAKRDTAAASEFSSESQTAIQKQLSILDSEVMRLTNAVNGGMSNVQYQERINTLMRKAIVQMPGRASDIRERVAALTGLPGAERWATMQYVRDRFTPPKETKDRAKTAEEVALKDIDDASQTGLYGTREQLLTEYRTNRPAYDMKMQSFKQVQTVETQNKVIQARLNAEKGAGDKEADLQRPSFAAVFSGALGTSVLSQSVLDKEQVYGTVLKLMSEGKNMSVDIVPFEVSIKMHQAQMRTNVEAARTVGYKQVEKWIDNNPSTSEAKRKEMYGDIDRLAERSLAAYADDKGVGLVAMATIMRTYRDKTLAEQSQLVDLAIKQQTAMQNNPMVMAYWAGGVARENLKVTNRSFFEFMVEQEKELTSSMAGVRASIKGAGGEVALSDVSRIVAAGQQDPAAVDVNPAVEPAVTRAAHQAQMATAAELLKKAGLIPMEVSMVSAAFATSVQYGANSQNLAKNYRALGDKILALPETDQAVIKTNVSNSTKQAVININDMKTVIETKYKTKLTLGVNDAGEITVVAPEQQQQKPLSGQYGARSATGGFSTVDANYTQATNEFNKQLRPMLNNIVFGRAMLTKETPQVVSADFATLINNNQTYNGFFSMEGKPVAATAAPAAATPVDVNAGRTPVAPGVTTPAAPAQATPAAPAASAAPQTTATFNTLGYPVRKPYESEDKYFKANPNVAGMATEDGAVILNPYSTLSDTEKQAVALNEAYRLYMRENKIVPKFELTEEQKKFFTGSEYANNPDAAKQTIVARILSGDPSAKATPQQQAEAKKIADQQKQKPAASAAGVTPSPVVNTTVQGTPLATAPAASAATPAPAAGVTATMAEVAAFANARKINTNEAIKQLRERGVIIED